MTRRTVRALIVWGAVILALVLIAWAQGIGQGSGLPEWRVR